MKKLLCVLLTAALLAGCTAVPAGTTAPVQTAAPLEADAVRIVLSDEGIEFPENSGVFLDFGAVSIIMNPIP